MLVEIDQQAELVSDLFNVFDGQDRLRRIYQQAAAKQSKEEGRKEGTKVLPNYSSLSLSLNFKGREGILGCRVA